MTVRPRLWPRLLPEMEGPVDVFASFVISAKSSQKKHWISNKYRTLQVCFHLLSRALGHWCHKVFGPLAFSQSDLFRQVVTGSPRGSNGLFVYKPAERICPRLSLDISRGSYVLWILVDFPIYSVYILYTVYIYIHIYIYICMFLFLESSLLTQLQSIWLLRRLLLPPWLHWQHRWAVSAELFREVSRAVALMTYVPLTGVGVSWSAGGFFCFHFCALQRPVEKPSHAWFPSVQERLQILDILQQALKQVAFGMTCWTLVTYNFLGTDHWLVVPWLVQVVGSGPELDLALSTRWPLWLAQLSCFWYVSIKTGWWFGTFFFLHILGIIIPIDFHIFQRGRSTTNQKINDDMLSYVVHFGRFFLAALFSH